jgi:hypothetical protein
MPDRVFELFDEFAAAWARGDRPSLDDYLEQAGTEAGQLARLVEEHVARGPVPEPSADGVERLEAFLEREPGLLVLRRRRGVRVDEVVAALVKTLGLDAKQRPKVKQRYLQLEGGLLDPSRVNAAVWKVLDGVIGPAAGDAARWGHAPAAAPTLRRAEAKLAFDAAPAPAMKQRPAQEPDEVDRLFGVG